MVRLSPGSPSQCSATLSPLPAATCRSTQLTATLSSPPTNHFANGGCQSSTSPHFVDQSSRSACSSQNAEPVLRGLVVEVGRRDGVRGELVARREGAVLVQEVREGFAAHGCSSLVVRTVDAHLSTPPARADAAARPELAGASRSHSDAGRCDVGSVHGAPSPCRRRSATGPPSRPHLSSLCSLLSTVPSQPKKKPSGIETRPGLSSGNQWKSMPGSVDQRRALGGRRVGALPDTTGEKITSTSAEIRPP